MGKWEKKEIYCITTQIKCATHITKGIKIKGQKQRKQIRFKGVHRFGFSETLLEAAPSQRATIAKAQSPLVFNLNIKKVKNRTAVRG